MPTLPFMVCAATGDRTTSCFGTPDQGARWARRPLDSAFGTADQGARWARHPLDSGSRGYPVLTPRLSQHEMLQSEPPLEATEVQQGVGAATMLAFLLELLHPLHAYTSGSLQIALAFSNSQAGCRKN